MICIYKSLRCISLYCLDYNKPCSKDPRPVSLNHNAFVINTNKLAITVQSLASVSLLIHAVYVPLIMFMSGHQSNNFFQDLPSSYAIDEHKLSVSSCLSNVTNPNQNNSCKITIFRAVHPHYHSPQHELILPLCFSPGRSRIALEWKAPNNATCSCLVSTKCHQKFSPSPSSITVFSTYRITLTERLMFEVDPHRFYWDDFL